MPSLALAQQDKPGFSTGDFPKSYKDPLYAQLDAMHEQKLGLPDGLISSIRMNGERTDNGRVSEAGAVTPYQFTPATRAAAIKKYGIDPTLSPQNASEVAGLLLKDSMQRNGGDPFAAVGEYHGGTDRSNWGPKTKAYVDRVMSAVSHPVADNALMDVTDLPSSDSQPSTFDKVIASQQSAVPPNQVANIYAAYKNGQMTPEEAQQFESDVKAGHIMLPRGVALNGAGAQGAPVQLPQSIVDAYNSGQMRPDERQQFEADVQHGLVALPQGAQLTLPPQESAIGNVAHGMASLADNAWNTVPGMAGAGIYAGARAIGQTPDQATANAQAATGWAMDPFGKTFGVQGTPGYQNEASRQALGWVGGKVQQGAGAVSHATGIPQPDAENMLNTLMVGAGPAAGKVASVLAKPALAAVGNAADATLPALAKIGAVTDKVTAPIADRINAAMGRDAVKADLAATRPGAPVGGGVVTPALGRDMIWRNAGTETPVTFKSVEPLAGPDGRMYARVMANGRESFVPADDLEPVAAQEAHLGAPPGTDEFANSSTPSVATMSVEDLGQQMRKAATEDSGSQKAMKVLAQQAAPDAETVAAAERLGIRDYLQPDHVTTNQAYRQLVQLVKSQTGSEAAVVQREGLLKVAQRANQIIDEVGGTNDVSTLSSSVRSRMEDIQRELMARADDLYAQVRQAVPANTEAPADNVLQFVAQRAKDVGGKENLSPIEKMISAKLSPKMVGSQEVGAATAGAPLDDVVTPSQLAKARDLANRQGVMFGQGAIPQAQTKAIIKQPTYALLDDVRRSVGAAARQAGPFKDADTGLAKKLYALLSDDQGHVVKSLRVADTYNAARAAVEMRKSLEDDMTALFGKQMDRSMAPMLSGSVAKLSKGDTASFIKMITAVPKDMRQEVTASGLSSFFQRNASGGEMDFAGYARWYEGLQRNQQAYNALMSNLPSGVARQLGDLARVSRGIAMAKGEFISTGKAINPKVLETANNMMSSVCEKALFHGATRIAAENFGFSHGVPGLMSALLNAMTGSKTSVMQAADKLIISPEFLAAARAAGTPAESAAVTRLATSKQFSRFVHEAGLPRALSDRQHWILKAMLIGGKIQNPNSAEQPSDPKTSTRKLELIR